MMNLKGADEMQFDKLEAYFEKQGYNTVIKDGTAPFRRLIVSKQHIGEEFYENEWNKLSKEEQVAEL